MFSRGDDATVVVVVRETLTRRVEVLEEKVGLLSVLPDRLTSLQAGVAALRTEMRAGFAALRAEMQEREERLRAEMREGQERLRTEMQEGQENLRVEMRTGDEETRRLMRVLHEDVIERIARLAGSGDDPRRRRRTR